MRTKQVSIALAVHARVVATLVCPLPLQFILSWNAFSTEAILLAWMRIIFADAKSAVLTAKLQDPAGR